MFHAKFCFSYGKNVTEHKICLNMHEQKIKNTTKSTFDATQPQNVSTSL